MNRKTNFFKITCAVVFMTPFLFSTGYAQEESELGFSGYIFIGGAYSKGDRSLDDASENDNRTLSSLSQSAKNSSEGEFVLDGALNYGFSTGTMVSLNMENGPGFSISQFAGDLGSFEVGGYFSKQDVWEDPFLTGRARSRTD